jgi:FdhE protein
VIAFSWDQRIRRAEQLVVEIPATSGLLMFYAEIARLQKRIFEAGPHHDLLSWTPALLDLVVRIGPPALAEAARALDPALFDSWSEPDAAHEVQFFARALRQPYLEALAARNTVSARNARAQCPACGEKPQATIRRGEGEGGKRFLLCSMCSTEWEFRRVLCPGCGEENQDKLPVFTSEQFPYVHVEACDTCRGYLKSIDLTKDGRAVPQPDEIATTSLNIWAEEQGYTKIQVNLLGM